MSGKDKEDANEDWVRIVSNEGYSYLVRRKVALRSGTLKSMLSTETNFAEASSKTCEVHERAAVVEKFVEYLAYKTTYENSPPKEDIPDFFERIVPEVALELTFVAIASGSERELTVPCAA
ncbi:hypothetical protein EVG20_g3696 [Dentipellis fragilis]|uniref:Elongin-C n=1 Tax=Dentipellis fragilis TaxID=205917 RepID=A0A4Y9Z2H9_9AGAM|nr:hypothetical protein EVG20_g3696 [Dentipellis fragilis]